MPGLEEVLERLIYGQEGYLGAHTFTLTLLSDTAVLPPWTGRTAKSIGLKLQCLEGLKNAYLEGDRFKPVTFSVLHHPVRGPLYVAGRRGRSPLVLSRGETVIMRVGFYTRNLAHLAPCTPEEVDVGYARFHVSPLESRFHSLARLPLRARGTLRIHILTPMTISTKIMAPEVPENSPLAKRLATAPERYRLLPTPGYIVAQLARQWLAIIAGHKGKTSIPKTLGALADALIAEQHHRLRPVAAVYGRDDQGRLRLVKGVIGTIEVEILDEWFSRILSPLLTLGELLGVGKSRSIGFGEIRLE